MKKCPECGVKHKHQRSAQGCYQISRSIIDHLIISGGEVNRYEQERADKMKKYYNSLPYPKDILKRLKL